MQIFNYFLFVCFINLCNSFVKQITPKFLSRDLRNKLNMGCDFYKDKDLHIYDYNDKEISYINVEHEKGYYWFISVLDEEGYDDEVTQYKKQALEPTMKPIVIYTNNTFNKLSFENKYKQIIETDIKRFNLTLNDVDKIIKVENRYER
jgi:hypothetical protein